MTYHIAIIDDNPADTAYVRALCEDWAAYAGHRLDVHTYPGAESFLFDCEDVPPFDMLLLDIEMGEMNGVELARHVRESNSHVQLVFITGYPDFIAEGYEVSALHYLMKPVRREKLFTVLDRAVKALDSRPRSLLLPVGKETVRIYLDDILYAESQAHYMRILTTHGEYRCRMTIAELLDMLGDHFARCHRSFLVALRHVTRITKTDVILDDGTALPLGKGMYDEINRALIQYLRER